MAYQKTPDMTVTTENSETLYEMNGSFLRGYKWKRTASDGTVTEEHAKTFEAANQALFPEVEHD